MDIKQRDSHEAPNGGFKKLTKSLFGVPSERGGLLWQEERPNYIQATPQYPDHALLARYTESRFGIKRTSFNLSSIQIQDPLLKDVVRELFRRYPGQTSDEQTPSFEAPFHSFFHQWATLKAAQNRSKRESSDQSNQIDALVDVLHEEVGDDMKNVQSFARNGKIIFRLLWTLFPPGCPVMSELDGKPHCFLVNEARYLGGEIEPSFIVELLLLDRDGNRYGWSKTSKTIKPFAGSTRIQALSVVPAHFCEDLSETIESLTHRGAKAIELSGDRAIYRAYEGFVRLHQNTLLDEEEMFVEGRIVVDPSSHSRQANRYSPSVYTIPHRLESFLSKDPYTKIIDRVGDGGNGDEHLSIIDNLNLHPALSIGSTGLAPVIRSTSDNPALQRHRWTEALFGIPTEAFCRSAVRGYCLTSKSWAQFDVDSVSDIQWNDDAFDALVMPKHRKHLIEALIQQQQVHKSDVDDIVRGKGQGLIMLLAGPPGTGKTLTAESIADRLRLPLYAVSAGEFGNSAKDIEQEFGQILRLAGSWNALLLLDEADAFLDRRMDSPDARERNKRVAGKSSTRVRTRLKRFSYALFRGHGV